MDQNKFVYKLLSLWNEISLEVPYFYSDTLFCVWKIKIIILINRVVTGFWLNFSRFIKVHVRGPIFSLKLS